MIWKAKAGKNLTPAIARELIENGFTAKQVTGFKGRSGRSFRAKLALVQSEEGKWRVEFDEPWAKEGGKPPEASPEAADAPATPRRRRGGVAARGGGGRRPAGAAGARRHRAALAAGCARSRRAAGVQRIAGWGG